MVYDFPSEDGQSGKCAILPFSGNNEYIDYYDIYNSKEDFEETLQGKKLDYFDKTIISDLKNKGDFSNIIDEIKEEVVYGLKYIKNVAYKTNSLLNNEAFTVFPTNDFKMIREYIKK
jgi:hypothetical protein